MNCLLDGEAYGENPGPSNLVVLSDGTIMVFYDYIFCSWDDGRTFTAVARHGEQFLGPFPLGSSVAVGPNDEVVFGEYRTDKRPHEVRIVRSVDGGHNWEVCRTFAPGEIFHIHSVSWDPYRERYWICTGDRSEEAYIFGMDTSWTIVDTLGSGDQGWRAVSLMIKPDALYWCSDNDRTASHVYKYDFTDSSRIKIRAIGKPGYASTVTGDGLMVFSTVYEPVSPYSRKNDPVPSTDLWASEDGINWCKIATYEAAVVEQGHDFRPYVLLPRGDRSFPHLIFTPMKTAEAHFVFHAISLEPDQN